MKTKKAVISFLAAAAATGTIFFYSPNAIRAQESMKNESPSLLESVARKSWHVLENAAGAGADYLEKKLYEAQLENQIEERIGYSIPDKTTAALISYLGLKQMKSADITSIKQNSVTADVYFSYSLDNLSFVEQYEFSLQGKNIGGVIDKGNRWIEVNGRKYQQKEGFRILHLYELIVRGWDEIKRDYERKNPGETFAYEKTRLSVAGNSAEAGINYHILDKFDNVKEGKVYSTTLEYVFSDGKWQFNDTAFYKLQKNPPKEQRELVEILKETAQSSFSKVKNWWRGE